MEPPPTHQSATFDVSPEEESAFPQFPSQSLDEWSNLPRREQHVATKEKLYSRRLNALAVRKSRKRKFFQQQQQLNEAIHHFARRKQLWKTRALTLSAVLQSHGIPHRGFPL
ncbi:hypothetical protein K438DRAFT_249617 [Mycena galopus ATCC 62051]|nr:hypothetical protein K438DRAFT_249617 [Mycena galopus ATCC 62051]